MSVERRVRLARRVVFRVRSAAVAVKWCDYAKIAPSSRSRSMFSPSSRRLGLSPNRARCVLWILNALMFVALVGMGTCRARRGSAGASMGSDFGDSVHRRSSLLKLSLCVANGSFRLPRSRAYTAAPEPSGRLSVAELVQAEVEMRCLAVALSLTLDLRVRRSQRRRRDRDSCAPQGSARTRAEHRTTGRCA